MGRGPTDPSEPYFDKGLWGFDGTVWRKLPLLWGYSDRYAEWVYDATMPAGDSNLVGSVVPAGEVWRVTGASVTWVGATCTEIRVCFNAGGVGILVGNKVAPVSVTLYPFAADLTLKAGDYMLGEFYGVTLNDEAYVWFWGYKMKVAQ